MEEENEQSATEEDSKPQSKKGFIATIQALRKAVSCSTNLLEGDDLEFVTATCPDVREANQDVAKRVAAILTAVSARYGVGGSSTDLEGTDTDSVLSVVPADSLFDDVRETVDEALEQFNSSLDTARGIQNATVPAFTEIDSNDKLDERKGKHSKRKPVFLDIEKPQIHFPDYPIDNSDTPFIAPYTKNAQRGKVGMRDDKESTADPQVGLYLQDLVKTNLAPTAGGPVGTKHPYEDEIRVATQEMIQRPVKEQEMTVYGSIKDTACTFVNTEEALFEVAERLKRAVEIAVDIENHSMRSFQGFTCLIQISTRLEDFIIDALALRGSIHRVLAPIFSDEGTVKVLHGADRDVQWLERDFGIYVVNMFDTGQAARLLKFPSAGLAYLQARFCNITGNDKKAFQLADWRQRPLPKDMFEYARSDTHYLLYIYDRLRVDLAKKELTEQAWEQSAKVARKRYAKARFDPGIARLLAARYGLRFDRHQTRLLEELCRWRDRMAREEDESLQYVAPMSALFDIVRAKNKARTVNGFLEFGFPSKSIPPLVRARASELVLLVCNSLDVTLDENGEKRKRADDNAENVHPVNASKKHCRASLRICVD